MAFNLGELLKNVSDSGTVREQIEYIKLDLIDGDEQNFYELSEIESLANNIATIGLQQPLRVRPHPTSEGRYMVVSGHRRRAALLLLVKGDPERWEEIACIVDRDTVSPALQQLRLLDAYAVGSGGRMMSNEELLREKFPITNADVIRAMCDDDLADVLYDAVTGTMETLLEVLEIPLTVDAVVNQAGYKHTLKSWLQKPAEEGSNGFALSGL